MLLKSLRQEDMAEGFLPWSEDDHQGFGMTKTQHKCPFINNLFESKIFGIR